MTSCCSLAEAAVVLCTVSFLYTLVLTVLVCIEWWLDLDAHVDTEAHRAYTICGVLLMLCASFYRVFAHMLCTSDDLEVWRHATCLGTLALTLLLFTCLAISWDDERVVRRGKDAQHLTIVLFVPFALDSLYTTQALVDGRLRRLIFRSEREHRISHSEKKPSMQKVELIRFKKGDIGLGLSMSEQPCHICLEELQEGDDLAQICCGHIFHVQCITPWLRIGCSCPLRCESGITSCISNATTTAPQSEDSSATRTVDEVEVLDL